MKKNTIATVGLALAVATAGLGFGATPAFAAPGVNATVTKTEKINSDEYVPAQEFEFAVADGTIDGLPSNYFKGTTKDGITIDKAVFEVTNPGQNTTRVATPKINIPSTFAQGKTPGVYVYTISETKGDYSGVTYSDATYRLFVQVDEDASGATSVSAVWTAKATGTDVTKATAEFINDYTHNGGKPDPGTDPDPDPEAGTHEMTVSKVIKGSAASDQDVFTFTITAKDSSNSSSVKDIYTVVAPDGSTIKLMAGESVTVTAKGGQNIIVKGLTKGDEVTVKETDNKGYTESYEGGTSADKGTGIQFAGNKDAKGTITNVKNNETPTGLFLNYAPFVVMVGAAGALIAVSKKRTNE